MKYISLIMVWGFLGTLGVSADLQVSGTGNVRGLTQQDIAKSFLFKDSPSWGQIKADPKIMAQKAAEVHWFSSSNKNLMYGYTLRLMGGFVNIDWEAQKSIWPSSKEFVFLKRLTDLSAPSSFQNPVMRKMNFVMTGKGKLKGLTSLTLETVIVRLGSNSQEEIMMPFQKTNVQDSGNKVTLQSGEAALSQIFDFSQAQKCTLTNGQPTDCQVFTMDEDTRRKVNEALKEFYAGKQKK